MYVCFVNEKFPIRSAISVLFNEIDYFHFEPLSVIFPHVRQNRYTLKEKPYTGKLKHINTVIKLVMSLPLLQAARGNPTFLKDKKSDDRQLLKYELVSIRE
jgi:hypothetical protein